MTTIKVTLVLFCSLSIALNVDAENEIPTFLCGRQLANARVILCYGKETLGKRDDLLSYLAKRDNQDNWIEDWPWTGRQGLLSWSRYKRDGLADLCCLKPCTTDVILNFC